jgi:hypothetical protein
MEADVEVEGLSGEGVGLWIGSGAFDQLAECDVFTTIGERAVLVTVVVGMQEHMSSTPIIVNGFFPGM